MTKRLISLIMAVTMVVMLLPAVALATQEGIAITNQAGLRKVLTSGNGGSYYLTRDITDFAGTGIVVASGAYTLDLSGHTISGYTDGVNPLISVDGGSLTVKDSAGGGVMEHKPNDAGKYADPVGANGGSLTISGGTYKGAYGIWCEAGTTVISGGTFKADTYAVAAHGGNVTINGGTFTVNNDWNGEAATALCVSPKDVKLTINGGTFKAQGSDEIVALCVAGGSCVVSGGTFTSAGYDAASHLGGNLAVNGGTFTGAAYGLLSASCYGNASLLLCGGRFSGGVAGLALGDKDVTGAGYAISPSTLNEQDINGESFYLSGSAVSVVMDDASGKRPYRAGQFKDVNESAWYGLYGAQTVSGVWENRLMDGVSADRFGVGSNLTVAQALVVADKINCMYRTGEEPVYKANSSAPWYQFYVDYAIENGIIQAGEFASYDVNATRAQMVHIFAHCLPESEFAAIGVVETVPDVKPGDKYADEILMFYQAGVLSGSDSKGTFHPSNPIKREEAAAIFLHVYDASTRSVAYTRFNSIASFNWSATREGTRAACNELLAAYMEPGLTDYEKAAYIHDIMVLTYHYDYDYALTGVSDYTKVHHSYTCLLDYGLGVCDAYSQLYFLLCMEAGVKCEMVNGTAASNGGKYVSHSWNRVWVDGQWLYVDVTYDDPITFFNGQLVDSGSLEYRLLTEAEMGKDHIMKSTKASI